MLRTQANICMNWRWNNTVMRKAGMKLERWTQASANSGKGEGHGSSEFGICRRKEPLQRWKWARRGFYSADYVFPLWKRSLMENKNKTTVSNYLILQILASCWPCEAGRRTHGHTQEVNQAAHWLFDWVILSPMPL